MGSTLIALAGSSDYLPRGYISFLTSVLQDVSLLLTFVLQESPGSIQVGSEQLQEVPVPASEASAQVRVASRTSSGPCKFGGRSHQFGWHAAAWMALQNYGAFIEKDGAGFKVPIKLVGFKAGEIDLSSFMWTYQVGLKGEHAEIFSPDEQEKVDWTLLQPDKIQAPFIWYKAYFDAPKGKDSIALDLGGMGKGQAWVNGHGIGRYWSLVAPKDGCPRTCNYCGAYNEKKCLTNCGKPTQSWYHIPREWLKASNNLLVLFEETGGNPLKIKLEKHATRTICAKVSETHYPPLSSWHNPNFYTGNVSLDKAPPEMHLHCDDGHWISAITFASFGTPQGNCEDFSKGKCHAQRSFAVISEACLGRNRCRITVSVTTFSPDPCKRIVKTLAVQAECSPPTDYRTDDM